MIKRSVYVETSIISYLAARPSNQEITRLRQEATWKWWNSNRRDYRLLVSDTVVKEISDGDAVVAQKRKVLIEDIAVLPIIEETQRLADVLVDVGPVFDRNDAVHIAVAAMEGVDYLLTWDFKHINNATTQKRIEAFLKKAGCGFPLIRTPIDMLEDEK